MFNINIFELLQDRNEVNNVFEKIIFKSPELSEKH